MSATDIVTRRTGMSAEDAGFYVELAEAKVRAYLHLQTGANLPPGIETDIAEIASLMWQQDQASASATTSKLYGVQSESFSEGGVSTSRTLIDGATSSTRYGDQIEAILRRIAAGGRPEVRFW